MRCLILHSFCYVRKQKSSRQSVRSTNWGEKHGHFHVGLFLVTSLLILDYCNERCVFSSSEQRSVSVLDRYCLCPEHGMLIGLNLFPSWNSELRGRKFFSPDIRNKELQHSIKCSITNWTFRVPKMAAINISPNMTRLIEFIWSTGEILLTSLSNVFLFIFFTRILSSDRYDYFPQMKSKNDWKNFSWTSF